MTFGISHSRFRLGQFRGAALFAAEKAACPDFTIRCPLDCIDAPDAADWEIVLAVSYGIVSPLDSYVATVMWARHRCEFLRACGVGLSSIQNLVAARAMNPCLAPGDTPLRDITVEIDDVVTSTGTRLSLRLNGEAYNQTFVWLGTLFR